MADVRPNVATTALKIVSLGIWRRFWMCLPCRNQLGHLLVSMTFTPSPANMVSGTGKADLLPSWPQSWTWLGFGTWVIWMGIEFVYITFSILFTWFLTWMIVGLLDLKPCCTFPGSIPCKVCNGMPPDGFCMLEWRRWRLQPNTLPELLCVSILGESFLYRMVRYIVSSILLVKIFGWLVWFYRRPSLRPSLMKSLRSLAAVPRVQGLSLHIPLDTEI